MSFVGGKLQLKGVDVGVKKKKKKKKDKELELEGNGEAGRGDVLQFAGVKVAKETPEGYILAGPDEGVDRRTAAEKRHDELMAKRDAERVKKHASKSHRERVNNFNKYLEDLSEHHDIPKVGPG